MDINERIDEVIAEAAADGQDAMGQLAAVWAAGLIDFDGPLTETVEPPVRTDI